MIPFDRRTFFGTLGLGSLGLVLSTRSAFGEPIAVEGKQELLLLNDRPINAETPVALLDDDITPTARHFVRNNGLLSERAKTMDANGWTLTIDGEVDKPLTLTLGDLESKFERVKRALVLECGGNGRAGFFPKAKGNQWTLGAVGCALYEGVRLRDVLRRAGVKKSAVYVAYYGEDLHLNGDPKEVVISRGVPLAKALSEDTILAFRMNGEPLPALHGFPVRLIAPGFPASASGKWLRRLWVRDRVHDGPKMTGQSYRVPENPVAAGTSVPDEHMKIIETMPVKSIITRPRTGLETKLGEPVEVRGKTWSGAGDVARVDVSFDFGATWQKADLKAPRNKFAWQPWTVRLSIPQAGDYQVWARATDTTGVAQPMLVPGWNPRGYLNNACQRIGVKVVA